MNESRKNEIVDKIRHYMEVKELSQNQLAKQLKGGGMNISASHLSDILNGKWKGRVSEELWTNLGNRFAPRKWRSYDTANRRKILKVCGQAQRLSKAYSIAAVSGSGKTDALRHYADMTPNCYLVEANQLMSRNDFIRAICHALGIDAHGKAYDMCNRIVGALRSIRKPVIIVDETDKLKDSCLMALKIIYDGTEGRCGFVTAGTEVLRKRVEKFAGRDKLGYREIKRRFFFRFSRLEKFDVGKKWLQDEIRHICQENGLGDKFAMAILHPKDGARNYGDVRRMVTDFNNKLK